MNIPAELTSRDQWIVWRYEKDGKPATKETPGATKVPYNAKSGNRASSTNPKTWTTFQTAVKASEKYSGVGYVFAEDDPYVGIDLDDCLTPDGLQPWAQTIVETMASYTEVSPSGKGVKIWVEGEIPEAVKRAEIEMYDRGRYFAVTGDLFPGTPLRIRGVNGALEELFNKYKKTVPTEVYTTSTLDDDYLRAWAERVIESATVKMRQAQDGERHNVRLAMGRLLGGLIGHGLMTEDRAERILYETRPADANQNAEHKAIRDGIQYGKGQPLPPPPPPKKPVFDSEGFACCPEHHKRLTKGKKRGWYCQERDESTISGWCDFWWEGKDYQEPKVKTAPEWRSQGVTLAQLQHKQFEPERWIVEDIFPEGACLLAAKYKSKKSWLALAISLATSMNQKALGRLTVSPGRVLYLDLEGKQQRIQKRTRAMLGVAHVRWPENFHIFTKWPQGDEGLQELEYWFSSYPDTALVVIDVLASFRRPMAKHEEVYRYDRDTIDPLNALFEKHHAGGLLVHHFNKGKHDDIMDSITGSTGLPSAVNTMWGFTRDPNDSNITVMNMRGRDLENDDPLALRWDSYLNQHVIEGPANEVAISQERKAILNLLSDDEPRTPKDIAAALERPVETVKQLLRKLLNDGLIDKPVYGKYAKVIKRDHSDHSGNSGNSDHSGNSMRIFDSKSDRFSSRVIGGSSTDHSVSAQGDALNDKSDRSDRYIKGLFQNVPEERWSTLRLFLRSNIEADQEQAQRLCRLYDVDYEAARAAVRSE